MNAAKLVIGNFNQICMISLFELRVKILVGWALFPGKPQSKSSINLHFLQHLDKRKGLPLVAVEQRICNQFYKKINLPTLA